MALITDVPFTGPNGSTTFTDTTGNYVWTAFGNAQIQSNALVLDGVGDYARTTVDGNLRIGPHDFRIEFDLKIAAADVGTHRIVLDQINTSVSMWTWQIYVAPGGAVHWNVYHPSFGNPSPVQTPSSVADDNWHNIVIERVGGSISLSLDGAVVASAADSRIYETEPLLGLGSRINYNASSAYDFKGSLRNFSFEITPPPPPSTGRIAAWIKKSIIGWDRGRNRTFIRRNTGIYNWPVPVETKMRSYVRVTRGVPPWWGPSGSTTQLPTYKMRGRVLQRDPDGVLPDAPVMNARVALYFRRLHTLIDIQLSDEDGYVQFDNLMPGTQAYYAIAFDPEGAPLQNSVLWDRLSSEPGP